MPTLRRRLHQQPPMAPSVSPRTLPRPGYPYASWWSRAGAHLIDRILAVVPAMVGRDCRARDRRRADEGGEGKVRSVRGSPAQLAGSDDRGARFFFYFVIAISNQVIPQGRTGQSLGKTWVGIAVIGEATGRPLGPSVALVRWGAQMVIRVVGKYLLLGIPGLLDSLWPLWDARHQSWHDKVAAERSPTSGRCG